MPQLLGQTIRFTQTAYKEQRLLGEVTMFSKASVRRMNARRLAVLALLAAAAFAVNGQTRLAETDEFQTAVVKKDAAAVKRLLARGVKPDFNFNEAAPRQRSGESPLTMAIGRGHLEVARILLEAGADPNRRDDFGDAPLDRARSAEAIKLLLAYGARQAPDAAAAARSNPRAIEEVIERSDDAGAVNRLLDAGADPEARTPWNETLIERALFRKRWSIVRVLADASAPLQAADEPACREQTWKCHSIQSARLASVDPPTLAYLTARGLDLDRTAANGHTALTSLLVEPPAPRVIGVRPDGTMTAPLDPPQELPRIRALLEQGADANRKYRAYTPLMIAVALPQKPRELADALVDFGGRVDFEYTIATRSAKEPPKAMALPGPAAAALEQPIVVDPSGILKDRTVGPLTWLVLYRRADLASRILAHDRRVPAADRYLLYFAASLGEWPFVIDALQYTKEVDAANRAGVTPLLMAAEDGHAEAVKALIAAGAKVNVRSDKDWPPLWETPPSMLFMGHGPSRPRLVGGFTPLRVARARGHEEVARLLRAAGAND
jgi:ankyrin repeat protein